MEHTLVDTYTVSSPCFMLGGGLSMHLFVHTLSHTLCCGLLHSSFPRYQILLFGSLMGWIAWVKSRNIDILFPSSYSSESIFLRPLPSFTMFKFGLNISRYELNLVLHHPSLLQMPTGDDTIITHVGETTCANCSVEWHESSTRFPYAEAHGLITATPIPATSTSPTQYFPNAVNHTFKSIGIQFKWDPLSDSRLKQKGLRNTSSIAVQANRPPPTSLVWQ